MTLPTLIPGYSGVVMLNSEDFTAIANVTGLNRSRNGMTKNLMGGPWTQTLAGKRSVAFSASGSLSAEHAAALNALFEEEEPIQFSLQVGQAGGATDGGLHSGLCVVTSLNLTSSADGEFDFAIEAASTGEVVYTPAGGGS